MVHSIVSLELQRVGVPKEPIHYMITTLQYMVHTWRTVSGDSTDGKYLTLHHHKGSGKVTGKLHAYGHTWVPPSLMHHGEKGKVRHSNDASQNIPFV